MAEGWNLRMENFSAPLHPLPPLTLLSSPPVQMGNAFQQLAGFFSGNQPEEGAGSQQESAAATTTNTAAARASSQKHTPPTARQGQAREHHEPNAELFDNEWRRKASEHAQLRSDCFKKADEAREAGDHEAANEYVKEVRY